jgi:hypothetical protein
MRVCNILDFILFHHLVSFSEPKSIVTLFQKKNFERKEVKAASPLMCWTSSLVALKAIH